MLRERTLTGKLRFVPCGLSPSFSLGSQAVVWKLCLSCCVKKQKIVDLTGFHCQMLQRFEILIFKSARKRKKASSIPFTSQWVSGVEEKFFFQGVQGKQKNSKSAAGKVKTISPICSVAHIWQLCLLHQNCPTTTTTTAIIIITIILPSDRAVLSIVCTWCDCSADGAGQFWNSSLLSLCRDVNGAILRRGNSRLFTSTRCLHNFLASLQAPVPFPIEWQLNQAYS